MADAKTVRLVNAAGVVVTTTEENAGRLIGFAPDAKKSTARAADAKSE